jgi:chromosome segregation ATPase
MDSILNNALNQLQTSNELVAAKATILRLESEVKKLNEELEARKTIQSTLREAGDDLWYCLRHRKEDPTDAIEEWQEVRNV